MRTRSLEPIIAQHPFFQGLLPVYRQLIVECAANVRFPEGVWLFREGEAANQFYLLRHGLVALQVFVPGRGPITLETLEAGEVLGWSWLFPPYRWHFDVQTVESTRAIAFHGECLRTKCNADPQLGYALMQRFAHIMMQRLQATRLQLLDLYGIQV